MSGGGGAFGAVAVLLAVASGVLLWPPRPRVHPPTGRSARWRWWRASAVRWLGFGGVAVALVGVVDGVTLALALVLLCCAAGVAVLVGRSRAARAAERRRERVVQSCEALVGELRAGQPLVAGLEHVASLWPDLQPVAAAARLGADVPGALGRAAAGSGAEGLREVAAAWRVSERSGAGLAFALSQVAATARERQATRHVVVGELASAQATARLVALLPLASLAMSAGIGGDPWHFLLHTPVGVACLASGAALGFVGLWWIDRIATAVLRT